MVGAGAGVAVIPTFAVPACRLELKGFIDQWAEPTPSDFARAA